MKATIKVKHGLVEVEGEEQKDLFKEMASVYEIFDEQKCGLCGSKNVRMVVRKNKDAEDFFEFQCHGIIANGTQRCRAYLYIGQNKKGGGLFPVRALDERGKPDRETGKFGKHNGWTRYRGEPKEAAPTAAGKE